MAEKSLEELLKMMTEVESDWSYKLDILKQLNAAKNKYQGSLEGLATAAFAWGKRAQEERYDWVMQTPEGATLFISVNKLRALEAKIVELQNEAIKYGIILRGRCDG